MGKVPRKKHYVHKFRQVWLTDIQLKDRSGTGKTSLLKNIILIYRLFISEPQILCRNRQPSTIRRYSKRQRFFPRRGNRSVELASQPLPRCRLIGQFYAPLAPPRKESLSLTVHCKFCKCDLVSKYVDLINHSSGIQR